MNIYCYNNLFNMLRIYYIPIIIYPVGEVLFLSLQAREIFTYLNIKTHVVYHGIYTIFFVYMCLTIC